MYQAHKTYSECYWCSTVSISTNNRRESVGVCLRFTEYTLERTATRFGTYVLWILEICTSGAFSIFTGFIAWISSRIPSDNCRVHTTSSLLTSGCSRDSKRYYADITVLLALQCICYIRRCYQSFILKLLFFSNIDYEI